MHRLGSPYGHCTHSAGSVDVRLLYKASYTKQVSGRGDGEAGEERPGRRTGGGRRRLKQAEPREGVLGESGPASGEEVKWAAGRVMRVPDPQLQSPAATPPGLPGLLLPTADGGDLLLRLLPLVPAGRG